MSICGRAITVLLALVGSCLSQDKGGVDQRVALPAVHKTLSGEGLSGSLEYWGFCDPDKGWPDFPEPRSVAGLKGSAVDILREMFADDPKMRVTQDSEGRIRMAETDVPHDFLEVKIHHFAFPSDYRSGSGPMAVYTILNTPEVIEFMERKIGREVPWEGWGMPGQVPPAYRGVVGELNDVTVAQALDHILQRFHGFWTYQNCYDPHGRRMISVGFEQNLSVSGAPAQTE